MRIIASFSVEIPEDYNDQEVQEWLEFALGARNQIDTAIQEKYGYDIEGDAVDWS